MNRTYTAAVILLSLAAAMISTHCSVTESQKNSTGFDLLTQPVYDFDTGPLTQFDNHCARCHGPYGSMYLLSFRKLNHEEMREEVYEMMIGPSFLKPSTAEATVMTDYHLALQKRIPFVCITNPNEFLDGKTDSLQGEASPNSTVTIFKGKTPFDVQMEKHRWTLSSAPEPPFTIQVTQEEKTITFVFPNRQWVILTDQEDRREQP